MYLLCSNQLAPFIICFVFFFFKQMTAYEMRISEWSSDVFSSDLLTVAAQQFGANIRHGKFRSRRVVDAAGHGQYFIAIVQPPPFGRAGGRKLQQRCRIADHRLSPKARGDSVDPAHGHKTDVQRDKRNRARSEEHTSELQSLMRISYAVFCLKKKKKS